MKKLFILFHLISLSLFAEVAIVVSKDSSLDSISKAQVKRIFLAKSTRLPNGERATVIEDKSENHKELFYKEVTNKSGSQLRSYWAKIIFSGRGIPPKQLNLQEVKRQVAKNSNVITYLPIAEVDGTTMKILLKIP